VRFGIKQQADTEFAIELQDQQRYLVKAGKTLIASEELTLPGAMGELNVLAALALVDPYINNMASIIELLRHFQGLPHRCQTVAENKGVLWVNDSKGTNPGATAAAIESFDRDMVLILGGVHKNGSLEALIELIRRRVHSVILFGRDAPVFAAALEGHAYYQASDLAAVVALSAEHSRPGDVVLFSPACASFDMFDNYQQRGDSFIQLVHDQIVRGRHAV